MDYNLCTKINWFKTTHNDIDSILIPREQGFSWGWEWTIQIIIGVWVGVGEVQVLELNSYTAYPQSVLPCPVRGTQELCGPVTVLTELPRICSKIWPREPFSTSTPPPLLL